MRQSDVYEYLRFKEAQPKERLLLVCKNDKDAQKTAHTATFLNYKTFTLPDLRLSAGDDLRSFQIEFYELLEELHGYYEEKGKKF